MTMDLPYRQEDDWPSAGLPIPRSPGYAPADAATCTVGGVAYTATVEDSGEITGTDQAKPSCENVSQVP